MGAGDDNDWFNSISVEPATEMPKPDDPAPDAPFDVLSKTTPEPAPHEAPISEIWDAEPAPPASDEGISQLEPTSPQTNSLELNLEPEPEAPPPVLGQRHSLVLYTECPPDQLEAALGKLPPDFPEWRHILNQKPPFLFSKLSETEMILLQMALAHLPIYFEAKISESKA